MQLGLQGLRGEGAHRAAPSASRNKRRAQVAHGTRVSGKQAWWLGRLHYGAMAISKCLRDGVHHHLVVHRGADVALGAKVLAAVVLRKDGHNVSMGKDFKGEYGV